MQQIYQSRNERKKRRCPFAAQPLLTTPTIHHLLSPRYPPTTAERCLIMRACYYLFDAMRVMRHAAARAQYAALIMRLRRRLKTVVRAHMLLLPFQPTIPEELFVLSR